MSGLDDASREDLLALIALQQRMIDELRAEIAELKRRVGMNSSNSSKPPSSDGPGVARKAQAPRGKSGRRPGKQPGTPGTTLRWAADPQVVDHVPASCGGCGCDLSGAPDAGMVRRQVVDVPEVSAFTVEHRLYKRRCGCGRTTTASAPDGVDAPVQYGPNLRALACYLVVFQHVPAERAALLIADVTGAHVLTGWIARTVARTAGLLAETEAFIKTLLTLAHVLHVDETSTSIAGGTQWLHVACTDTLTAYHLHPFRGLKAVEAFGVLPVFAGTVVHDSLAQYRPENFPLSRHALCGAHYADSGVMHISTASHTRWFPQPQRCTGKQSEHGQDASRPEPADPTPSPGATQEPDSTLKLDEPPSATLRRPLLRRTGSSRLRRGVSMVLWNRNALARGL